MYKISLNGLGIYNYENNRITGEYCFLKKIAGFLGQESVVLDVGANVGCYSNLLRKLSPQAKIYAFEPHPKTFETLQECAQKNDYHAFQVGCGKEDTELKLYDFEECDGSTQASIYQDVIEDLYHSKSVEHTVNIITLDDFLAENKIDKVDLVKIDVEGNEFSVLEGLQESIKNNLIEIIHWEFNHMNVVSKTFCKDFYEILRDYNIFRMLPDGLIPLNEYNPLLCEIYGYQNLVAVHKQSRFNL